ncbi:MAG: TonB-dependent receptor [Bacteroidaceae bacterium]|nr:TonB-dependent receptor [Bacteroidaceae bacterium]
MLRFFYCLFVCFSLAPYVAVTAQEPDTLQYLLPEIDAVEMVLPQNVTSAVPLQRVSRNDIMRLGFDGVADALKYMSGVNVRDYGGAGGLKTVSVRGMGAKHTAVSYDGVMVADAQSGVVDLGRFPLSNLSAVTLAVGQGSDGSLRSARVYSASALLSLCTLTGDSTTTDVEIKGGAFGYAAASFYHRYKPAGKWGLTFNGNYLRSDGMYPFTLVNSSLATREIRRDSDIDAFMLEANADVWLGGGKLDAKVYCYSSERGLPGATNFYNKGNRERLWNRNAFAQARYVSSLGDDWRLQALFKYDYNFSRYREVNSNYSSGEQVDVNIQNECYASLAAGYVPFSNFNLSLAADVAYTALENNFENSKSPRRFSLWVAAAAEYELLCFKFSASLLATSIVDKVQGGDGGASFFRLSPSFGVAVSPFDNDILHLRASVKDAFRVPTFADLYYLRLGNVGLKPEKATQCNIGATLYLVGDGFFKNITLSVDGYYNNVRDKIVALPTMYVWRMMNFGEADIWGVDASGSLRLKLTRKVGLLLDANYSCQYAVDVTDATAKNFRHQLPYTPRHSGSLTMSLENPILNVSYLLSAVGERYMLPQNTVKNRMQGYIEHGFSLNRSFSFKGVKLRLQAELLNVANRQYEVIKNYPMPGFQWRLSARVDF